ncbi:Pheromone-regulated multispanning membrane protein [Blumeria graminis f. sp. tritici 96224]|nr:Pheromone-regulated multispanning membrane protein [Blumeria graminis f. sp. tritici 96224]
MSSRKIWEIRSRMSLSAENRRRSAYPNIPMSLNIGTNKQEDFNLLPDNLLATPPYLGLRARLSQVWVNQWTILLLLILCRLLLVTRDIQSNTETAKEEALQACTSVESIGSAMASMPHYLSSGVNTLTANTITHTVNGLMDMMLDSLDVMSNILLFVINMFTQTYACLITFAVTGSLSATIELIEKVGNYLNETVGSITTSLASDTKEFQDVLNDMLKKIQIPPFLSGTRTIPKIDLSRSIDALHTIKIDPSVFNAELNKLNASLPTFADVQNFTSDVIKLPFTKLKTLVNDSRPLYTFDHNIFSVAPKKELTFCSDSNTINNFFDDITSLILKGKIVLSIFLSILAVLLGIFMALKEVRVWRKLQDHSHFITNHAQDRLDLIYISSRLQTATAGIHIASKFFATPKRRNLARWFIAYITSFRALFLLSLGFSGLFSCFCQYVLLQSVKKEVPQIAEEIGNFTGKIVHSLNDASKEWAVDANYVIEGMNSRINKDVLGWVQVGTSAVNMTVDMFTLKMNEALNTTFGGTVLYKPVLEVMNCLVGLKVASFQKGLTWVQEHAHVKLPELQPDVFSIGAATSLASPNSFLASPGSTTSDKVTSAVEKVIKKLQDGIRVEAIISSVLVMLWLVLVLMALCRVLAADSMKDYPRHQIDPPDYTDQSHDIPMKIRRPQKSFVNLGAAHHMVDAMSNANDKWDHDLEKYGQVAEHQCVTSPGFERKSSHGSMAEIKL